MKSIIYLFISLLIISCEGDSRSVANTNPLHLPPAGFIGNSEAGADLYLQFCITCHGTKGKGTTQGPPLVHKTYEPSHHADLAFHLAVSNGVRSHHWNFGDMKPIPEISPEQVAHIIQFIRKQQQMSGIQ